MGRGGLWWGLGRADGGFRFGEPSIQRGSEPGLLEAGGPESTSEREVRSVSEEENPRPSFAVWSRSGKQATGPKLPGRFWRMTSSTAAGPVEYGAKDGGYQARSTSWGYS